MKEAHELKYLSFILCKYGNMGEMRERDIQGRKVVGLLGP